MIAPPMNTRSQETLLYRDLARRSASLTRSLDLEALPRLQQCAVGSEASATSPVDVALTFSENANGAAVVEGRALIRLDLECHRCAEARPFELAASFHCVIVGSEAQAEALDRSRMELDVLVASGTEVTVAEIVEDELLLALPDRLCSTEPCEYLPALSYPAMAPDAAAAAETAREAAQRRDNPFRVLADLKTDLGERGEG